MSAAVSMQQTTNRRSALTSVRKGIIEAPLKVLIYGGEKVGKSTFAAGAPSPIFIGADAGTEHMNVSRLQPTSWSEMLGWVNDLANDKHDYETLALDPFNWLEPMAWDALCEAEGKGNNIETFDGGYKKGYIAVLSYWRELLFGLERCGKRGMHVILSGHSHVIKFENPEGPAYERYEIATHPKLAGLLKQWVNVVLFTRLETFTKVDKQTKKAKAFSSGARVMHTTPSSAYDAGSRWTIPDGLPLSWDSFFDAVKATKDREAATLESIASSIAELKDPEVTKFSAAFAERHKTNIDRLTELANRLALKLETKKAEETK